MSSKPEVDTVSQDILTPKLPAGRFVDLGDRGTIIVRDFGGRPEAPVIALLHGWTATADLNWFKSYDALGEHFRVIAFDHRGHGTGVRTKQPFRLEDCADDVADVAAALGVDTFIPVGYSMGGPIAQLVWKRHPERVTGLVLCATAPYFAARRNERRMLLGLTGLAAMARVAPEGAKVWLTEQLYLQRKTMQWEPWAIQQTATHDWRMVLEAGSALGKFSSTDWLADIDVPVSNVLTMRDQVIPLRRQVKLFELIPDAEAFRVDGMHDAAVANADRFVPSVIRAIESVERRS
ncbi:MAG TPA: alpha/beta hydrolase [Ilumatobacteraceae bacterium]|nr:alpha/beta hydrolase [Ilumatobacteraceae bacterium]